MVSGFRIGTCSWKYDSWRGLVYSDKPRINYLGEYAKKYDCVEVDQWSWSLFGPDKVALPKSTTVQEYALSVPENFRFAVKLWSRKIAKKREEWQKLRNQQFEDLRRRGAELHEQRQKELAGVGRFPQRRPCFPPRLPVQRMIDWSQHSGMLRMVVQYSSRTSSSISMVPAFSRSPPRFLQPETQ